MKKHYNNLLSEHFEILKNFKFDLKKILLIRLREVDKNIYSKI